MKLYFFPGACSLAAHIALYYTELPFTAVKVNPRTKQTETGDDFTAINAKGYVPALALDNGEVLTELAAVLHYIADQKPAAKLLPAAGSMAYYHALAWVNYVATEVHKNFAPLFDKTAGDDARQAATAKLKARFDWLSEQLEGRDYLQDELSVADLYLYTVLNWPHFIAMDMTPWPVLQEYVAKLAKLDAVQQARRAEKLPG